MNIVYGEVGFTPSYTAILDYEKYKTDDYMKSKLLSLYKSIYDVLENKNVYLINICDEKYYCTLDETFSLFHDYFLDYTEYYEIFTEDAEREKYKLEKPKKHKLYELFNMLIKMEVVYNDKHKIDGYDIEKEQFYYNINDKNESYRKYIETEKVPNIRV